jgi:hypothetical protein
VDEQFNDLRRQIGQVSRTRRDLARSVDASRTTIYRALSTDRDVTQEHWQLPPATGLRRNSRAVILLLLFVALLTVVIQFRWVPAQQSRADVAAERVTALQTPTSSNPPAAPAARVSNAHPLVIHIKAIRPCRVRVVVDGTVLEWRSLRLGDEFFSRPNHEFRVQSDDGGALLATVNGDPVSVGADGHAIAVRFTPARPFPELASAP